jgi:hypothetical protein
MALSSLPFDGTTVTAPNQATAAAAAAVQPYDNTDTIVLYNESTTDGVLVQVRTAPVAGANPAASSVYVPPASALTLPLGDVGSRQPYGTGAGQETVYYSSDNAAATASVRIAYLNNNDC